MTVWVDVDDLIGYFYAGNRPSGIQRLSFDLASALVEAGAGRVRACRHGPGVSGFTEIDWIECRETLNAAMHETQAEQAWTESAQIVMVSDVRAEMSSLRRVARGLPTDLRGPVAAIYVAECNAGRAIRHFLVAQVHAARGFRDLLINVWRWVRPRRSRRVAPVPTLIPLSTQAQQPEPGPPRPVEKDMPGRPVSFAPGDVLVSTGATWQFSSYAAKIDRIRAMGVRFAPFAHDMVPLLFPEWSVKVTTDAFETWARRVLTRADILFANSEATARDVARYAAREHLSIPPALKLPMGASFGRQVDLDARRLHPRPFVLFVSTIEPRKNHAGMLRLWRRLISELPVERVPDLVMAGRVGWMARDIVAQAENADWFGGKVRLIEAPGDAELASLYRDCLFTVYPSFYEGWGLPVTESLSFGKPVAASNRASIPEAGGEFCVYFDPDDLNDAFRVISGLINEPDRIAVLEQRIRDQFRPPSWHDSARAILAALDAPPGATTGAITGMSAAALSSQTG